MRAGLPLGLMLGVLAGPALAQTTGPDVAAEARATQPQGVANGATAGAPNVAPDVTVTGHANKPCGARDQSCVDRVSAEIWSRYPKQIQAMCDHQRIYALQEGMVEQDVGLTGISNDHLTPQTEALCDYGRTMKAEAAKAATPPPAGGDPPH